MEFRCIVFLLLLCSTVSTLAEPSAYRTVVGSQYRVDPAFLPVLNSTVERLRGQVRAERAKGKLIGFISIPLSSRNGGDRDINVEVCESVKRRLENQLGPDHFWALAPGLVESTLPAVGGKQAQGGEYMYLWTQVLAGETGLGEDFDLIYFTGPGDFAEFFALTGENDLERLSAFLRQRARVNSIFAERFATDEARRAFLSYYGLKASTTFSEGAHDEWNIFQAINRRRREAKGPAWQLPILFDGRQVPAAVLECPVSKGYEL